MANTLDFHSPIFHSPVTEKCSWGFRKTKARESVQLPVYLHSPMSQHKLQSLHPLCVGFAWTWATQQVQESQEEASSTQATGVLQVPRERTPLFRGLYVPKSPHAFSGHAHSGEGFLSQVSLTGNFPIFPNFRERAYVLPWSHPLGVQSCSFMVKLLK